MPSAFGSGAPRAAAPAIVFRSPPFLRAFALTSSLIALGAMLLLAAAPRARAENGVGSWAPPASWPLIAIHMVLMPDGRVLSYGTDGVGKQTGFYIYDVWDTSAGNGAGHMTLNNTTGTDLFCSSQIVMSQTGTVLINGGDVLNAQGNTTNSGNDNSNVFTPTTNVLARGNPMNRERWYSSATTLFNGEIYVQGGNGGGDRPDVRGLNGVYRLLDGVNTSSLTATFPRNFLAPDGRIFGYDVVREDVLRQHRGLGQHLDAGPVARRDRFDFWCGHVRARKDPAVRR